MNEIESKLSLERLDKDLITKKGRAYIKTLFMDFQRNVTDLNLRVHRLPVEQRSNPAAQQQAKIERQKILDSMLVLKGLTLDELNYGVQEFDLLKDPEIMIF